ncbi:MFS transporter [Desertivirga xinjiangensis]|uniref:MFS transporter n=1 Tax=Desertivirga xinjiangensis TaxID=539206 RepID=UPI002108DCC8|nr:MFS transporter [Pedobacter xinjiangensis]
MQEINRVRLFNASSVALVVTALTFAIRANLLGVLANEFGLSPQEIGEISSAAFWGFTIAMFIGGPICDYIGMGRMFLIAFIGHFAGIILTIYSTNYWTLFSSTLLIGIGNGFVESASYAMVSSMYTNQKAKKINDWHIWFPAGIVIGGVLAYILTLAGASWRVQMIFMIVPTIVYGWMFLKQHFPKSERVTKGVSDRDMLRECFKPLFLFMIFCMLLTGATELGTNQWIAELLSTVGVPSILLLVFINGIMTIGRANAGFILKRVSTIGLLLFSSVFSLIGLIWLSYAEGYIAFAAAGVFAAGVCFFWPTMIGFVSENLPKTGPLGMSLMGGVGLLSTSLILPVFGIVYENQLADSGSGYSNIEVLRTAVAGSEQALQLARIKLEAGAGTLRFVSILPAILVIGFFFLYIKMKKKKAENVSAKRVTWAVNKVKI